MKLVEFNTYKVRVESIRPKLGIVVRMEDGSTELIHISKISVDYVDDIRRFVSEGDEYEAMCIEGLAKPLELSLLHLGLVARSSDEETEDEAEAEAKAEVDTSVRRDSIDAEDEYGDGDEGEPVENQNFGKSKLDIMIEESNKAHKAKMSAISRKKFKKERKRQSRSRKKDGSKKNRFRQYY